MYTDLPKSTDFIAQALTGNDNSEQCVLRQCDVCRDKLDQFAPQDEIGEKVVKWYQWRKAHGSGSSYIDRVVVEDTYLQT